jgi:flagellar biosynthesis protein FlhA
MAINPGQVSATLPGTPTSDPAFGLPAIWIDSSLREQAQIYGYTVVDASTVVATHLNHLIHTHAAELLGRQEVQQLLDHVGKDSPLLVQDLVPKSMSLTTVQKVLKNLLDEEVPIRDMRTILEVLAEHAATLTDTTELTSLIRLALSRAIIQQIYPGNDALQVIGLDSSLDRILLQALSNSSGLEPGLADRLLRETQSAMERQMQQGLMPVLVVQHPLRVLLSRFLRRNLTQLKVLSQAEIPDNRTIKVTATIGGRA